MHIYFSGMGGAGIGPLALIAKESGFTVSGSDKKPSSYINYLAKKGIKTHIGQKTNAFISEIHANTPIDWFVYSSALPLENPNHPELKFVKNNNIKYSKRDEFLNYLLKIKKLKMLAVAGTHGKTTTTGMLVWIMQKIGIPISYSLGAKTSFAEMGSYDPKSEYFIYECDEFDKNFLAFNPFRSIIASVDWDHHEIYPTRGSYKDAFRQFIANSSKNYLFIKDAEYLNLDIHTENLVRVSESTIEKKQIQLYGEHNRRNALLCVEMLAELTGHSKPQLIKIVNQFPGTSRRFEKISDNVFTDYAHAPEEIAATLQLASEHPNKGIVAVYEPLTDRRQHFMKDGYRDVFEKAEIVYWLPSYLAREDPTQQLIQPSELIAGLNKDTGSVHIETIGDSLKNKLLEHNKSGKTIIFLAGGGGGSLDDWARLNFSY